MSALRSGRFATLHPDASCQRKDCGRPLSEHQPGSYGRGTSHVRVLAVCPWYPADWSSKDANGKDLGYPGPDGVTLYYRGFPASEWPPQTGG